MKKQTIITYVKTLAFSALMSIVADSCVFNNDPVSPEITPILKRQIKGTVGYIVDKATNSEIYFIDSLDNFLNGISLNPRLVNGDNFKKRNLFINKSITKLAYLIDESAVFQNVPVEQSFYDGIDYRNYRTDIDNTLYDTRAVGWANFSDKNNVYVLRSTGELEVPVGSTIISPTIPTNTTTEKYILTGVNYSTKGANNSSLLDIAYVYKKEDAFGNVLQYVINYKKNNGQRDSLVYQGVGGFINPPKWSRGTNDFIIFSTDSRVFVWNTVTDEVQHFNVVATKYAINAEGSAFIYVNDSENSIHLRSTVGGDPANPEDMQLVLPTNGIPINSVDWME